MPTFTGKNVSQVKKAWNEFFINHPEYKILHSHVRSYASLYLPIAKKYGLKTIIHSHSTSNGKGISAVIKRIMQRPLRYQADYLFACSQISGEWLFGKKAIMKSNYKMVPNAINLEKYIYSDTTRNAIRLELNIPESAIVLGHVGRFHEAKNHLFLLDVFNLYKQQHPNSILLLVGDGDLREEIERKIHKLKLESAVVLTGARNDVNKLLSAMDYFVFPSNWEGLPVTVVEAQATGLHCFISDTITHDVEISEIIKYLPINQGAQCWVEAINNTVADKVDVHQKIIAAGFDMKKTSNKMTVFYKEIIHA